MYHSKYLLCNLKSTGNAKKEKCITLSQKINVPMKDSQADQDIKIVRHRL